jgi:hypothetical protein
MLHFVHGRHSSQVPSSSVAVFALSTHTCSSQAISTLVTCLTNNVLHHNLRSAINLALHVVVVTQQPELVLPTGQYKLLDRFLRDASCAHLNKNTVCGLHTLQFCCWHRHRYTFATERLLVLTTMATRTPNYIHTITYTAAKLLYTAKMATASASSH